MAQREAWVNDDYDLDEYLFYDYYLKLFLS